MNKVVLGGIAAAVVVAGAGTASMVLTEQQIDRVLANAQQQIPQPLVYELLSDSSTFTNRQVNVALAMDIEGELVKFIFENEIVKRPWGTTVNHVVKFDDSLSEKITDDVLKGFIDRHFIQQALMTGTTTVTPLGSYQTTFTSLTFNDTVEQIDMVMTAFNVSASGNFSGDLTMAGDWAGFSMAGVDSDTNETINMAIKPVTFSADGQYQNSNIFIGTQTFNAEGFSFNSTSEWDSTSADVGAMSLIARGAINDESKYDSDFVWNVEQFSFSENGEALQVNNLNMAMVLNGLNAAAFNDLVNEINAMPTDIVMAPNAKLMNSANLILRDGFDFALSDLSAQVDGQALSAKLNLVLPKNSSVDINSPMSFLGVLPTLTAGVSLTIDQSLEDHQQLGEMVSNLQEMGLLKVQGAQYVMNASFENGLALLNGAPIPLPF